MLVPLEVFKVSEACDKESSRYGSVKLERQGEVCRAIATNGKILSMFEWNDSSARHDVPNSDVAGKCDMMVAKKHWQKLCSAVSSLGRKAKPVLRHGSISETDKGGDEVMLTNIDADLVVETRKIKATEGRFPRWQDVYWQLKSA